MEQLALFKGIVERETKYDYFDKNISNIRQGYGGETLCRKFLQKYNKQYHQIDLIFENDNSLCSIEVKATEMYNNPNAHGLKVSQFNRRMNLYNQHKIIPYLFIDCQTTKKIYWNSLIELKNGKEFYSKKGKYILFPIESYKVYEQKHYS